MKHRGIMSVIFFSIITFGIYDLFWLVSVKKELNAKTKVHTPTLWLLFAPTLIFVAALAVLLVVKASSSGTTSSGSAGSAVLVLVFDFIAILALIPITFYWFFKFSKAVNEYTSGEMSTAVTFILLYMLRFIGMAVLQDKFNDMIAAGNTGAPLATAPATVSETSDVPVQAALSDPAATPVGPTVTSVEPVVAFPADPAVPATEPTEGASSEPVAPSEPASEPSQPEPSDPTEEPPAAPQSPVSPAA